MLHKFFLARDRGFESVSLQQRVYKLSVPRAFSVRALPAKLPGRTANFCGRGCSGGRRSLDDGDSPNSERYATEKREIIKGPALETSHDDIAIVRWTTTNPGGDDDHYSVIHYGTDPNDLSQTAKNHIRLNQSHPETVFRVRMDGLKPDTTYYYKVTSMGYDGVSDGVESPVRQFTTAAPGQQTSAHPLPQ
jgi:hypothetical protein